MLKASELAGIILLEFVWIGFWFLVDIPFIAIMGIVALVVTLINVAASGSG